MVSGPVELCNFFRSIGDRQVAANSVAWTHILEFASDGGSNASGQVSVGLATAPMAGHSFGRLVIDDAFKSEELNGRTPVPGVDLKVVAVIRHKYEAQASLPQKVPHSV